MSLYFRHITPSGLVSNTLARKPSFPFSVARLLIYHPESLLDVIIGAWKGSYISQPRTHDPHTNKPHLERPGLSWRCSVARKPSTDLCYIYTDSPAERATERRESLCRVFTSHGWLAATRRLTESLSCPDRQAHEPRWGDWHAGWLVGPNKERKKKNHYHLLWYYWDNLQPTNHTFYVSCCAWKQYFIIQKLGWSEEKASFTTLPIQRYKGKD